MCLKLTLCFSEPEFAVWLFSSSYIIAPPFPWSLSLEISEIIFNSFAYLSHLSSPVSSNSQSCIHTFLCAPGAFYVTL